jgi:predicted deacylase
MSVPSITLRQRTITGQADGLHLLITGGVHGDEFEPMAAIRRLMREIEPSRLRGRITLVPVVNEPAFARRSRVAEDEKDLARTCPGRDDGSITERIAAALSRLIHSADFYVDLHTAGSLYEILPLAGYVLHADPRVLDQQRQMTRAFNLPIVWGTSARLEGRSLSVARDANIPAIYVEHGGGGRCDPAGVDACVEGCLNVARLLDMLDHAGVSDRVRYVVEDDRDGSGHLQAQHTAPVRGYFEPAVRLGQVVEPEQPLGRILDPLGEAPCLISAQVPGMVVFLRTFPSVQPDDPLTAILPIRAPGDVRFRRST